MTQITDPRHFAGQVRRIRATVSTILTKWGLLPRFKRWRLTQDPETGMIVLFGILNNSYIATHTSIPFSNYFDSRLLRDLSNELQVQIVSCNSDGLRYAFILDRGQLAELPTHVDYPFIDNGKVMVRVVYNKPPEPIATPPVDSTKVSDHRFVSQVAGALLNVFDDIKLRDDAALLLSAQNPPDIVIIDEVEFNQRVAEHEVNRQKVKRIKDMFDDSVG
ncbi:MAG: hypothetical protein JNM46_09725 [Anaerolineales bacterium]|nr:hypothetical protein [Anaerolineales bacterium]